MSIVNSIHEDLKQVPIWSWMVENKENALEKTYYIEDKDYKILFSERDQVAWIEDMQEFFTYTEKNTLFKVICSQFNERKIWEERKALRDQEDLALKLFPNVDLSIHTGDEKLFQGLSVGSPQYEKVRKVLALSEAEWKAAASSRKWGSDLEEFKNRVKDALMEESLAIRQKAIEESYNYFDGNSTAKYPQKSLSKF